MLQNNENKLPRLDIMLDMETAGISEDSAILDICMVPFTTIGADTGIKPFYAAIDLTSCFFAGMSFDADTQRWWIKQHPKAKMAIIKHEKRSIESATRDSFEWLESLCQRYDVHMWCRGLNFDIPKYEYLVRRFVEKPVPYKYWNLKDARTYCHTFDIKKSDSEFEGTPHCSIDDCMFQIKQVQAAYRVLSQLKADTK